jgi:thiamine transporter ThiT
MKDRFTNGFIAGLLGGVVMGIMDLVLYFLGVVQILFLDWASVLIFGYRFATLLEAAIGQIGQLFFSAVAGVLFAFLLSFTSSRYYLFKGWVYGLVVWFGTYSMTLLFKVTPLIPIKPDTVISNMVMASVYGLVLAESLRRLSSRKEIK